MHRELMINLSWCCQPHRMGHGQPPWSKKTYERITDLFQVALCAVCKSGVKYKSTRSTLIHCFLAVIFSSNKANIILPKDKARLLHLITFFVCSLPNNSISVMSQIPIYETQTWHQTYIYIWFNKIVRHTLCAWWYTYHPETSLPKSEHIHIS